MPEYDAYTPETDRFGEPLPVGAHEPDEDAVLADPPGMPHAPDEVDRELARYIDRLYTTPNGAATEPRQWGSDEFRPDNATVEHARHGQIIDTIAARTVREALLLQVQTQAKRERDGARDWAAGVRAQQEGRDLYLHAKAQREEAEQALRTLDLWTEKDDPEQEAKAPEPERIPDDQIV